MLAAQALTSNDAAGGRLVLGIGLSHKTNVEGRFGISYSLPARHMEEYLQILLPLIRDRKVDYTGEVLAGHGEILLADAAALPVLLAALQPRMLALAGGMADGTITWCTGPVTLEAQIVPLLSAAAEAAARPAPRVVVALPTIVTEDEADGRIKAGTQLEGYGNIPVYRAVLDREGVEGPADIAVVGNEASVTAQLRRLADIGMTEFIAIPCGTESDRSRTRGHLATLL
jgi:F420-dependent oxidoreductase-like protein